MSDPTSGNGPDTQPIKIGGGERRRAAIALAVLAVGALVLVAIMVYVFGSNGKTTSGNPISVSGPSGPAVTVTGGPHNSPSSHHQSHRNHPTHNPSQNPSSAIAPSQSVPATGGPSSCETSSPCELPTDVGNAVGALNDYRAGHGVDPVNGAVTKAAQECALANGQTSSCPSGYFWEPVPRSGRQVIEKIAAQSSGSSWLLDKTMTRVEVGWVYIPSSHSYEVAVVADH
ncbi:MAG TPA: hypothetical protein VGH30_02455 [Jatrophihabitantaceae bacterium]|jgi:hypothetical protein